MTAVMAGEPASGVSPDDFGGAGEAPAGGAFEVHLEVFEGPFDLLLGLISKHKLDITEVALSQVTDEFIAYIRARADSWELDQASYFLVVAATLLDLKAARLLPSGEVEDEDDLELLEARDLLFARLLQYRAYKEVAAVFVGRMTTQSRRYPRRVPVEPRFAELLPEVLIGLGPAEFARLAAAVLTPKPAPVVSTAHIHSPRVSVRETAAMLAGRLRGRAHVAFRELIADAADTYDIVARFLAVLELYREGNVSVEQAEPFGDLRLSWLERADGRDADGSAADGGDEEDYR